MLPLQKIVSTTPLIMEPNASHNTKVFKEMKAKLVEKNVDILKQLSAERLADILKLGFAKYNFHPFRILDEPDPASQLRRVFRESSPEVQAVFLEALNLALAECDVEACGPRVLCNLAVLAGYTRAARTVKYFRPILLRDVENLPDHSRIRTVEILLAVLSGFAQNEEVRDLFKKLYYDDRFTPEFTAQLFVGLCKSEPLNFIQYVPHFLDVKEQHPEAFEPPQFIILEFVDAVSLDRIGGDVQALDRRYWWRFFKLLCRHEWSPANLGLRFTQDQRIKESFELSLREDSGRKVPIRTTNATFRILEQLCELRHTALIPTLERELQPA